MAGDKSGKNMATDKLKKNAEEIAIFLNGANPNNWSKGTMVSLLLAYGGYHICQIDAVLAKDYGTNASIWKAMKPHIYAIVDALAAGIVTQFPKRF